MNQPPSPDISPSLQIKKWIENPIELLTMCEANCGDSFTLQLGSLGETVFFSDPKAIREIFAMPSHLYECCHFNESYRYLMGEKSLFLQDRQAHKQKRKLLMPFFHRESIEHYAKVINEITQDLINKAAIEKPFKLRLLMHEISLQVILMITFGDLNNQISQILSQLFKLQILQDFGSWSPWSRLGKQRQKISQFISAEIKQRRKKLDFDNRDILTTLILATDDKGENLTDEEIQDHLFTLLIAAVDPTAIALTWAIHLIYQNTSVKNTLQQELDQLDQKIHPLEFIQLPYLTATCQEVLRLFPPLVVPSGRKLTQMTEINGYQIAKGATVVPCIYLLHRRSELYLDSHIFKPERFLERHYSSYEYIPFGGGNRMCIGSALAQMELKLVLATILSSWEFDNIQKDEVKSIRHGTIMAPSDQVQSNLNTLRRR